MGNIFSFSSSSKDGSMGAEKQVLTFGPHGGQGGDDSVEWDDGINDGVKQLIIYTENEILKSVEIEYVKNGDSSRSKKKHGGEGGTAHPAIKLNYPSEYLVSMSVYYGSSSEQGGGGGEVVQALKFRSNKNRQFGPYGTTNGTPLESQSGCGKIIGFKGKSSDRINSIGAYFLIN